MLCSFIVDQKNNANAYYESDSSSLSSEDSFHSSPEESDVNRGDSLFYPESNESKDWDKCLGQATLRWSKGRHKHSVTRHIGGAKKNKWTPEEDTLLDSATKIYGTENWRRVATLVPGRSGKQCRERWLGHMSPDLVREDWLPEEDLVLLQKQQEVGNKWAKIKESLPGRSTTAVKNRWNWLCRRNIPNHTDEYEAIIASHKQKGFVKQEKPEVEEVTQLTKIESSRFFDIFNGASWRELDNEFLGDQELFGFNVITY